MKAASLLYEPWMDHLAREDNDESPLAVYPQLKSKSKYQFSKEYSTHIANDSPVSDLV